MSSISIFHSSHYRLSRRTFRVVCLGHCLQEIFLIDHDDFIAKKNSILVGEKVAIDQVSYQVGGSATNAAVTFTDIRPSSSAI